MIPIKDVNFQKIICFYLFECPARSVRREEKKAGEGITKEHPHPKYRFKYNRVSQLGLTFEDRGIVGAKLNTLRAALLKTAGKDFVLCVGANKDIPKSKEYIWLKDTEFITEGIFRFIRNSFAHGEFDIKNKIYRLVNHSGTDLKGQAVISERTLLEWIKVVNMSIEDMRKL